MSFFRDLFPTRRRAPRVAGHWMGDLAIPHTDPQRWIGLFATDLSAQGIRLQGLESDDVRRLLTDEGHAQMTLRLPLMRPPPPPLAAELRWGLGEKPNFYTGWLFSKIDADTLKLIDNYIADHPQDLIKDPTKPHLLEGSLASYKPDLNRQRAGIPARP